MIPFKLLNLGMLLLLLLLLFLGMFRPGEAQTYSQTNSIFKDKLDESIYNTDIRPVMDQSKMMGVVVIFSLVSIVEINDVDQSFLINGFLNFIWKDEIVAWDPNDYGGQVVIYPIPEKIWVPRVILVNTLADRDLFDDDKAPTYTLYHGETGWAPGSLFPTSCELNLTNYPFDRQTCIIELVAMRFSTEYLQFFAAFPNISLNYFITNGEWELQSTELIIRNFSTGGDSALSCIQMKFFLKRRPAFLILNIILPVVFLSFLNILVFVIPVESGEKIGYGITVLLALSVFMSIVSGMLPRSSLNMPNVTIYLFFLLFLSMLTVIDSIIIVYLHHKEGEEATHQKVKSQFRGVLSNVTKMRNVVSAFDVPEKESKQDSARKVLKLFGSNASLSDSVQPSCDEKGNKRTTEEKQWEVPKINKYKLIGKHIDSVSFVIFLLLWLASTLGFMLDMALS